MGTDEIRKAWNEAYKPLVSDISDTLTLEEICCIFFELGWNAAIERNSVVKWQNGEPKEEGEYLVVVHGKRVQEDQVYTYDEIKNGSVKKVYVWTVHWPTAVTAWCKLSDIKPYKEEEV